MHRIRRIRLKGASCEMTNGTQRDEPQAADVLVIFGITGDLAKVMTFRSLYRLERRGLLDVPDRRRGGRRLDEGPARRTRTRVDRRHRRDARRGRLRALRRAPVLRPGRLRRRRHLRARRGRRSRARRRPVVLPRDPAVPVRPRRQGAGRRGPDEERADRCREAVRPRPRVGAGARGRAAPVHRRVAALPDRPLPREDGHSRRSSTCGSRNSHARADLEPQLRRVRPDHDGRELRGRGPRPLLRPGRGAPRRRREPLDAGGRRGRDGAARRRRPEDAQGLAGLGLPRDPQRRARRTTCAGSTTGTSRSTG